MPSAPNAIPVRVLLKPPNLFAVENEIHLPKIALRSAPDGVAFVVQFDGSSVLDESLLPNLDECLLEGKIHCTIEGTGAPST